MTAGAAPESSVPQTLCGYPITQALKSTQADESDYLGPGFLGIGHGGRRVVLKPLDPDCLLKERLTRVRELALGSVTNLYGAERDAGQVWLIWEYAAGRTLAEFAADPGCTARKLTIATRELVLSVEAMHRQGIIHGDIRASNVIVTPSGNLRLTHVSPLLYTDPGDDLWGVLNAIEVVAKQRTDPEMAPLSALIAEIQAALQPGDGPAPSREALLVGLTARLSAMIDVREQAELSPPEPEEAERRPQRRALLGAAVVMLFGLALGVGLWWILRDNGGASPTWIQSLRDGWK
jgi:hypothetical protein